MGKHTIINAAGGSGILSIQNFQVTITATNGTVNQAISTVNQANTIVNVVTIQQNGFVDTGGDILTMVKLTSSTNVELTRLDTEGGLIVSIQVIEFYNLKSLQQNETTATNGSTTNVAITEVNLNKTMLFSSRKSTTSLSAAGSTHKTSIYLSTSTNIVLENDDTQDNIVYWYVVEFY